MPTPDPSLAPVAVWVSGLTGDALDWVKFLVVTVALVAAVLAFSLGVMAGLAVRP